MILPCKHAKKHLGAPLRKLRVGLSLLLLAALRGNRSIPRAGFPAIQVLSSYVRTAKGIGV